ncbi:hypothetical protein F5B22DRAFT_642526 [Xylaria bambusicola]|uniref:uncharacterized protein n=1 Tax=Xylaria bambusicola TaxID=326684 RepID=UPI00200748C9|nr:uncharacterized protein F5B22DRAFT_642526 [Xylaria bambusicola]KAI0525513.1 hypothetical protein F5B22DRAFT_642526 [Xylaria bambusicola]
MTPADVSHHTRNIGVKAPWGCQVETTLNITGPKSIAFSNITRHKTDPAICKCRRNPNKELELAEEEKVARHVHTLWVTGKCDALEMAHVFAKLKLGLPVREEFDLHWNEETKTWGNNNPQRAKDPAVTSAFNSSVAIFDSTN